MKPDRIVIVGVGVTGESCIHFWYGRAPVFVTDTRLPKDASVHNRVNELRAKYPEVRFISPAQVAEIAGSDSFVYMSPGIPMHDEMFDVILATGARLTSDIELFMEQVDGAVIGITGTNGKSTTTDLTAKMLQPLGFKAGGNIGVPVLDLLSEEAPGFVLELSSFQLERMRPPQLTCATVLNIAEDHLDHHRTFAEYAATKRRIYERCELAVFNNNDPRTAPGTKKPGIAINGSVSWCVRQHEIVIDGQQIPTSELQLLGSINHYNIVAAAALAHASGVAMSHVIEIAQNYQGLPHRLQTVARIDNVHYVNDSKATNVAATLAALEAFADEKPNIVLLAGGEGKDADFASLNEALHDHVKTAVLFGKDAQKIAVVADAVTQVAQVDSLEQAVLRAREAAKPGDVILLSPACASFDMFANFEHRGDSFTSIVQDMAA